MAKTKDTSRVEIINGRFVAGTKERLEEIARMQSILTGERVSVSKLVEDAVNEKYPKRTSLLDKLSLVS